MLADSRSKTAPLVQSKGVRTRERILDLAFDSIVAKGFAATSIEELIEGAKLSKSGFFYHFKDKSDLAHGLLERYVRESEALLDELEARARALHDDPLHAMLIFLRLYAESLSELVSNAPGCLVATITYQENMFDPIVRQKNRAVILSWRARFLGWLEEIERRHPLKANLALVALADHVEAAAMGGIVLAKSLRDPQALARQVLVTRETIRMAFGA